MRTPIARHPIQYALLLGALLGGFHGADAQQRALDVLVVPDSASLRCEVLPPSADSADARLPALTLRFVLGQSLDERTVTVSFDSSGRAIRLEDVSWTVSTQMEETLGMIQAFFDPLTNTAVGLRVRLGPEEARGHRAARDSAEKRLATRRIEAVLTDAELLEARQLAAWLHRRRCTRET